MSNEILINVKPNQTRVAYVENGVLSDLKVERIKTPTNVGSVFKGKVVRVLPGMQAAFVDIGLDRSAFYMLEIFAQILTQKNLSTMSLKLKMMSKILIPAKKMKLKICKKT
jgi:Rne/Rng family ribonuclease